MIKYKELELNGISEWEHPHVQKTPTHYVRHNVALLALMQVIDSIPFVICTGHTYWDPRCDDGKWKRSHLGTILRGFAIQTTVKLMQMHALVSYLSRFVEKKKEGRPFLPFILCGDFNAQPESSMYHYVRYGCLQEDDPYRERYLFQQGHK